jgi:uncharacterized membrane protein
MGPRKRVKDSFVAGLILVAPLAITLYVLSILVNWSLQFINPLVRGTRLVNYTANIEVVAKIVAVVLIVSALTLLVALAQWSVGLHLFGNLGLTVNFIPLVSTIYASVRQVATSLVDRDSDYDKVVLVEYPREGIYCIGLVTANAPAVVETATNEDTVTVYLPNSPNPTAGRLLLVPVDEVHEVDMTVRRGLRLLVTTGMGSEELEPAVTLPHTGTPSGT